MQMENVDNFFEVAKLILSDHMKGTDHFFEKHSNNLRIRFSDMTSDPVRVIKSIDDYLELNAEEDQILQIKENFSKERVSKLIEKLNKVPVSDQGQIYGEENINAYQLLRGPDGRYRVLDNETRFQTNHITSKKEGEWIEYFTAQQQLEINNLVAEWLEKYNFQL